MTKTATFILTILLLSTTLISPGTSNELPATNGTTLKYKQELLIPIDTNLPESKYQPIDMRIQFTNPCWGVDEYNHSIRIYYDDGNSLTELESQIYDIEIQTTSQIKSCSIVFLIPEQADGNEQYYVFYDDTEQNTTDYPDHLNYEDTHYFYEPISGQIIDFDYYKIIEDNYIVYGIIQKGEILGNGMSNTIATLKPESTQFETTTIDQLATFYLSYSTEGTQDSDGTGYAPQITKTALIDGNLMQRFRVTSISPKDDVQTDNIYTYYYNPTANKRMNVNVNHDIIKDITATGDQQQDPAYVSLVTIKARSKTITKMNLGNILPNLHFYSEDQTIKQYPIPSDPNTEKAEWILTATDDANIGEQAWVCQDDSTTGKTHALIFEKHTGYLNDTTDGLEVKASTKQHVNLPGLEADSGTLYVTRNSYTQGTHKTTIDKDTTVNFNVEFMTFQNEGYEAVPQEAQLYQQLIQQRPIRRGNETEKPTKETTKYTLTAVVHFAPSVPLGSILSAATGKNISYISAELYKNNQFSSSGSVARLALGDLSIDTEGQKLIQKIRSILQIFDFKNTTLFKKIIFPGVEPGTYLIKIFKENTRRGSNRKFIGFSIVDVEKPTKIHIFCKPEGTLQITVENQNQKPIENIKCYLTYQDLIITEIETNEQGTAVLNAPIYTRRPYLLQVTYDNIVVHEETIKFRWRNQFLTIKQHFEVPQHTLSLSVKDVLGLPVAVDISPTVVSQNMRIPLFISANKKESGTYLFPQLTQSTYTLKMSYKSFISEEIIKLDKDISIDHVFPAEFLMTGSLYDSYGNVMDEGTVLLERMEKTVSTLAETGMAQLLIPPGEYILSVIKDETVIARQHVLIAGEKSLDIVTQNDSLLHTIFIMLGIVLIIMSIVLLFSKKTILLSGRLIVIGLLLVSLFSPWWALQSEDETISTVTNTLLIPSKMVTVTTTNEVIGGEISFIPEEFSLVLTIIAMILTLVGILFFIEFLIHKKMVRLAKILRILSPLLLIMIAGLFFYAMSQVTDIGIGSFSGSGDIEITVPGFQEKSSIFCSWGPAIGFHLLIASAILSILFMLIHSNKGKIFLKIESKINKNLSKIRETFI